MYVSRTRFSYRTARPISQPYRDNSMVLYFFHLKFFELSLLFLYGGCCGCCIKCSYNFEVNDPNDDDSDHGGD